MVYILADALPGFSNFYINYILLSSFLQAGHLWQLVDDAIGFTYQVAVLSRNDICNAQPRRKLAPPHANGNKICRIGAHLVMTRCAGKN